MTSQMREAPVIPLRAARERRARTSRAIEARRRLNSPRGGRAWINGREVGGASERFRHLGRTHD